MIDPGAAKIIDGMISAHLNIAIAYESNARRLKELVKETTNIFDVGHLHFMMEECAREGERNRREAAKLYAMKLKLS